jgi:hypothetical protein
MARGGIFIHVEIGQYVVPPKVRLQPLSEAGAQRTL